MPQLKNVLQGSNQILDAIRPMMGGVKTPSVNRPQVSSPTVGLPTRQPIEQRMNPIGGVGMNPAGIRPGTGGIGSPNYDFTQSMNPFSPEIGPAPNRIGQLRDTMNPPNQGGMNQGMNQGMNPRGMFQGRSNPFGDRMSQLRDIFAERRVGNPDF